MRGTDIKAGALIAPILLCVCSINCNRNEKPDLTEATGGFENNAVTGLDGSEQPAGNAGDYAGSGDTIANAGSGGESGTGGVVGVDGGVDANDSRVAEGGVTENEAAVMDSGADARDSAAIDGGSDTGDSAIVDGNANEASGENTYAGTCCSDGHCLCRGPVPLELTSADGPYETDSYYIPTGTVYYPIDAEPPFASIAISDSFTGGGTQMMVWVKFFPTHGIVTILATTAAADIPAARAGKLLAATEELRAENINENSPLFGMLSDRYGVLGYAMGASGASIASVDNPSLLTSVGMATWSTREVELRVDGSGVKVPTLLFCGYDDEVAPCSMSEDIYDAIPGTTPKMMISIPFATHFSWFGPTSVEDGLLGKYTLAFQKVFLEGDERWKPLLLSQPNAISDWRTNIQ